MAVPAKKNKIENGNQNPENEMAYNSGDPGVLELGFYIINVVCHLDLNKSWSYRWFVEKENCIVGMQQSEVE